MTGKKRETPTHLIGELFTFVLFGAFLLLSLLIVVIGVDGYRGAVGASEASGDLRTSLGYVAGKVRSEAAQDGATLLTADDGLTLLSLTEAYDGVRYDTVIYYYDGALHEAYIESGLPFSPTMGVKLCSVGDFRMEWADEARGLLVLTATARDGRSETLHLAIRQAMEVGV